MVKYSNLLLILFMNYCLVHVVLQLCSYGNVAAPIILVLVSVGTSIATLYDSFWEVTDDELMEGFSHV